MVQVLSRDFNVASNRGNWAYVAGVGSDPRGRAKESNKGGKKQGKHQSEKVVGKDEGRRSNPVNQGFDYNPKDKYVKTWVEELSGVNDIDAITQPRRMYETKQENGSGRHYARRMWIGMALINRKTESGFSVADRLMRD
ncbi:Putative cryptochrome DASH, mitochondrial [Leucoagaricus sp. SymC.cos]|nr:Putative cryptochrome DASH, mitochondrial [Leucoagaricus sp. SymC.cos]